MSEKQVSNMQLKPACNMMILTVVWFTLIAVKSVALSTTVRLSKIYNFIFLPHFTILLRGPATLLTVFSTNTDVAQTSTRLLSTQNDTDNT